MLARPAGARTAARLPGRASARRGASRRRSPPTYSTTPQASQRRLSEACVRPTKPVRPSWSRWNQWTTSPSRNCCEACRRICRRATRGVHPDQVHRVLELVAEAVGPAGLVEPAPRPDPLGQRLVFQPVEVAVELRAGRSGPGACPSGRATSAGSLRGRPARRPRSLILADDRLGPVPVVGLAQDHDDRALAAAPGSSSVVRNAATGRSSRVGPASGSPCSTSVGMGDARGRRRRSGLARSRRSSGRLGHGDEGRPGAERVPRVLEEEGVERPVAPDLERPGVFGLAGQHHLEVGGEPQPPGRVAPGSGPSAGRRPRARPGGTNTVSSVSSVPRVMRKVAVPSTPNSASCEAPASFSG